MDREGALRMGHVTSVLRRGEGSSSNGCSKGSNGTGSRMGEVVRAAGKSPEQWSTFTAGGGARMGEEGGRGQARMETARREENEFSGRSAAVGPADEAGEGRGAGAAGEGGGRRARLH